MLYETDFCLGHVSNASYITCCLALQVEKWLINFYGFIHCLKGREHVDRLSKGLKKDANFPEKAQFLQFFGSFFLLESFLGRFHEKEVGIWVTFWWLHFKRYDLKLSTVVVLLVQTMWVMKTPWIFLMFIFSFTQPVWCAIKMNRPHSHVCRLGVILQNFVEKNKCNAFYLLSLRKRGFLNVYV